MEVSHESPKSLSDTRVRDSVLTESIYDQGRVNKGKEGTVSLKEKERLSDLSQETTPKFTGVRVQ